MEYEEKEIKDFLNKYKDAKKTDFTSDGSISLKDKFKELWENYISRNPFSHQSKVYLFQGFKFESSNLLWKYICDKNSCVDKAKSEVKEEFESPQQKGKTDIPQHLLELFTFLQVLNNHEKEIAKQRDIEHSLKNKILGLESDIRNLKTKIEQKQLEIENLHNAVAEQKELKSVIAKDEAQKVVENYQKISNELSYGYSTFLEAKDMPMSADLGEILRDQLREVYAILSKHGISFGE